MSNHFKVTRHDGQEVIVRPHIGHQLRFEQTLKNNPRWGTLRENPIRMQLFTAWAAGNDAGTIPESWDEFTSGPTAALAVAQYDPADDELEGADDEGDELDSAVGKDTYQDQPAS